MRELYKLPEGWEWKKLGELCNFIRGPFGGSLKKQIFKENGNAVYEQSHAIYNQFEKIRYFIDDEKFEEMKRFELKPNSLIMSCSGTIGKVAIVPNNIKKGIINQALLMLTPSIDINNIFLKLLMESSFFQTLLSENSTGAAIANVASVKVLKEISIPLPPLQEQKRIVAKLDALFEKIDRAIALHQKNMDEADAFMGSVLNDVFGELEKKYKKYFLKNYCQITSSKRVYKTDYVDDGIMFYRIKDIVLMSKNMPLKDCQYIKKETFNEFDKKFGSPRGGDILLTAVGATLGYAYLVKNSDGKFYFKDGNLLWLKNIIKMDSEYLTHIFKSPLFDKYLDEISKGAAQPAITIIKLKEFRIPIPPLKIQQKTVNYLDEISSHIERVKELQKEKMQHLKALKASILDQAFRGQL